MRPETKKVFPLVGVPVLLAWFVGDPGELRVSSGVDCLVSRPPLVAPRTLNPKP